MIFIDCKPVPGYLTS